MAGAATAEVLAPMPCNYLLGSFVCINSALGPWINDVRIKVAPRLLMPSDIRAAPLKMSPTDHYQRGVHVRHG